LTVRGGPACPIACACQNGRTPPPPLRGINAAVIDILAAALYTPIWTSTIFGAKSFALALAAFGLLQVWRVAPWIVMILTAAGGALLAAI